jgi:hypothetical protein
MLAILLNLPLKSKTKTDLSVGDRLLDSHTKRDFPIQQSETLFPDPKSV